MVDANGPEVATFLRKIARGEVNILESLDLTIMQPKERRKPKKRIDVQPLDEEDTSDDVTSTVPVVLSRFLVNRQILYEISDLFYTHTVWTFPSVEVALKCLHGIPPETRRHICKIDFTVSYTIPGELKIRPGKDLEAILHKLPRLRVLTVHVRLEAFASSKSSWEMAVKQRPPGEQDRVAAKWVNGFVKRGLEDSITFSGTGTLEVFY